MRQRSAYALLLVLIPATTLFAQPPKPVVHLTAEQDHLRTMNLLDMSFIRLGKDVVPGGRFPANYDEAKANPFPAPPDPLTLKGKKGEITNAKAWWEKRRPQIVEDFDREVYGRVPANAPAISWQLKSTVAGNDGDTPTRTQTLIGHANNSAYPLLSVDIELSVTVPANQTHPVPVILNLDSTTSASGDWQHKLIGKGWGYAILSADSVQPDDGSGLTQGIIGLANYGQPRKLEDWGALRAWAWGASRALDYLATDTAVDAHQVGVQGHARYGKAALVAMAYDQRFAVAYVSSSGVAGAKLSRRNFGEVLENVTASDQYHLMAGNFIRYAGTLGVKDLPVDAHELIALCAPRPVYISSGTPERDSWSDPRGTFMAAAAAGPVYRLLGQKDLATVSFPSGDMPLIAGNLAFREHSGDDYPSFVAFAAHYLKTPGVPNRQMAGVSNH